RQWRPPRGLPGCASHRHVVAQKHRWSEPLLRFCPQSTDQHPSFDNAPTRWSQRNHNTRRLTMNILALGSTGKFAGHVVPALAARGHHVRGFVHDPAKAERARAAGAKEAVVGDLRTGSLPGALEGMDGMFLILPAFAPDAAELGVAAVQAASAAGVRRVVFNS